MKQNFTFLLIAMTVITMIRADFVFYQGLDSDQGDITNLPGRTIAQLQNYCEANADCLGFNTNGWVKNKLKPLSQWNRWSNNAAQGFYFKVADFSFAQGVDSDGGDITNLGTKNVAELKVYCSNNPNCLGFNTNGWVKSTLKSQSQWNRWSNNANEGFYWKQGYTYIQGLDSDGGDITNIPGKSATELKLYCSSNPSCLGFNTNGWVKSTIKPRNQWNRWSNTAEEGFYLKKGQYTFYQGLDSDQGDIKNIAGQSVEQLKSYCDSDANCLGFNTNGWIKKTLKPQSQWNRWSSNPNQGFYVKVGAPVGSSFLAKSTKTSKHHQKKLHA